jgi:hypothetical protein
VQKHTLGALLFDERECAQRPDRGSVTPPFVPRQQPGPWTRLLHRSGPGRPAGRVRTSRTGCCRGHCGTFAGRRGPGPWPKAGPVARCRLGRGAAAQPHRAAHRRTRVRRPRPPFPQEQERRQTRSRAGGQLLRMVSSAFESTTCFAMRRTSAAHCWRGRVVTPSCSADLGDTDGRVQAPLVRDREVVSSVRSYEWKLQPQPRRMQVPATTARCAHSVATARSGGGNLRRGACARRTDRGGTAGV